MNPFRSLALISLTVVSAIAQDAKPTRAAIVRLLAFDATSIPKDSFAIDPGAPPSAPGIPAPIKGYLNHESIELKLFGSEIRFSKSSKPEDLKAEGNEFAKVTLPASGNRFILMFLPIAEGKFRIFPIDDSIKAFPRGSYLGLNLSRHPVKLTLEDKPYAFKSGESLLITDPPVRDNQHSSMYAFAEVDGKWQRIGSGLWPHPGSKRAIQIFFDNPGSGQTELRSFRDISPPDSAPSNAQTP